MLTYLINFFEITQTSSGDNTGDANVDTGSPVERWW